MTDAEFVLDLCARHRKIYEENIDFVEKHEGIKEAREENLSHFRGEIAKLNALEALAKLEHFSGVCGCTGYPFNECDKHKALRDFRQAMEGK